MFWFLLISLVVVVAAVTLAVVGSGEGPGHPVRGGLADVPPDLLEEPLPPDRPVDRADVDGLRLPVAVRGYRMQQVDDVLDRLAVELAERDARIARLESALASRGTVPARHSNGTSGADGTRSTDGKESTQGNTHGADGVSGVRNSSSDLGERPDEH